VKVSIRRKNCASGLNPRVDSRLYTESGTRRGASRVDALVRSLAITLPGGGASSHVLCGWDMIYVMNNRNYVAN